MAIRAVTFPPPPDWPKIVTFAWSPPKLAMLSRTHSSAAMMSSKPTFPDAAHFSAAEGGKVEEANGTDAVIEADDDNVMTCEVLAIIDVHFTA